MDDSIISKDSPVHKYDIVKIKSCTFLEFFIKIQLEFCIFKSFVCVREPATFGHSGDEIVVNHHMIFSILGFCFILSYLIFAKLSLAKPQLQFSWLALASLNFT